jgi:hypothetical protein
MITNPDDQAFPVGGGSGVTTFRANGLTKRELFAILYFVRTNTAPEDAVKRADKLIEELNKTQ